LPSSKSTSVRRIGTTYYDRAGVLAQVGLYHEPVGFFGQVVTGLTHPLTVARAYLRMLFRRSA